MKDTGLSARLLIAILAFALIFLFNESVNSSHTVAGKAFDYTTEKNPMTDAWVNSPIKYSEWAKGADLAVTLDQHLYAIMLPMVKQYAIQHNLDIAVKEGTCGISAGMLLEKQVDVSGFCCPAGRNDRLPGLKFHTVGIAPLAIIVNPDNPTTNVTAKQARQLFSGEIKNWAEIAGPKIPVVPIARLHCKARPGHWRLILDNEDQFSQNMSEVGSIPDMVHSVSSDIRTIGHLATWNIYKYKKSNKLKALNINGISPFDSNALREGRYPFYRSYNITTWTNKSTSNKIASDLVDYLVMNTGNVPSEFGMIPAATLLKAGWKFEGRELVGEPN